MASTDDGPAPFPERRGAETGSAIVKAIAAAVPVIGGTAAELWDGAVAPVIAKRQVEWFNDLANQIYDLREQSELWAPENLGTNDAFVTAVMTALEAVRRTHQAEKIDARRNAVLNTVAMADLAEHERTMFMQYVADLEPLHLQLLKYAVGPTEWFAARGQEIVDDLYMGGPIHYFARAFPDLDADVRNSVIRDLMARGLSSELSGTTMTAEGARQPWGSDRGRRFIRFIEKP